MSSPNSPQCVVAFFSSAPEYQRVTLRRYYRTMVFLEKEKTVQCLFGVSHKEGWNEYTNDCGNQNLVQDYCCSLIEVSNKQEGKPILCLGLCSVCVNLSLFSLLSDYLTYYCLVIQGVRYVFHLQVTSVTKNPPCWAAILCGRVCECECVCARASKWATQSTFIGVWNFPGQINSLGKVRCC